MRSSPFSFFALSLLLGVLATGPGACGQGRPRAKKVLLASFQTDRFRLSAAPGCADGYPATIAEGRFLTSDGGSFPVPYGHFLKSAWGGSAIGWAVGEALQPAPDSLEIRWFSYTENKFYEGHFLLPQQRIHALLKQGFWQPGPRTQGTYTELAVSVVPTGVVVVWLRSRLNQVLIGRYQAREIQYDYARFQPGSDRAVAMQEAQAAMSPTARHEQATHTISSKKWDDYLKTYPWQVAFSQPLTLTTFGISYLNAESLEDPPTPDLVAFTQVLLAPGPKPVPNTMGLVVSGPYGRQRRLDLDFSDEHETQTAFRTLAAQHPTEPITLFVEVDEQLSKATLSLRAGGQVVALPKSKAASWPVK